MKRCKWSEEEISYIKENAIKLTVKEMSIYLDRSEKAIREKLRRIGCGLSVIKNTNYTKWNKEEDDFLINNYLNMTTKEIACILNRPEYGVKARKNKLKLNNKYKAINNSRIYKFKDKDSYDLFYEKNTNTLRAYHRVVYENYYNVKLNKKEKIHHIDGNKKNNNPENLLRCADTKSHRKIHAQLEKIAYQLIQEGFIIFDKNKQEYIANSNRRLI